MIDLRLWNHDIGIAHIYVSNRAKAVRLALWITSESDDAWALVGSDTRVDRVWGAWRWYGMKLGWLRLGKNGELPK